MSIRQKRIFQTEQELWQAFLSSDKDAFAWLFEKYADAMYAYGSKMTSDTELIKDAIQDVFIKLYKNRQNLRKNVSVKGYLFVALKRTLLNLFQTHTMLSLEEGDEVYFEIDQNSQKAFEEVPLSYDEEIKLQLSKALKTLTARQQEAIYLYYIQEIPLKELSTLLDMNYQSTRNLIHRAMTKLRQHIQPTFSVSIPLLLFQYLSE
ncbi:RNA polymerase sigma factor [uncultured Bacteroides sp.]|uniref:RNA polymerase sigma factor n=1 Tax=uncultured Bacteroides sp. TaxID=162156 RepID=UPI0025EBA6C6|nr:sigma-70 family RNA polymerase sigma factor [uncultured Bacteroides sp.]